MDLLCCKFDGLKFLENDLAIDFVFKGIINVFEDTFPAIESLLDSL